jgi:hypothetical protein
LHFKDKVKDFIQVRGEVDIKIFKNGKLIGEIEDKNLIVNLARNTIALLIGGDGTGKSIAKLAVGENSSAATPDDEYSDMTNPFQKAVDGHTYPQSDRVKFTWSIATTEANGLDIWEFGLLSSDDTLFARKVRSTNPIHKDSEIDIQGSWTIIL